MNMDEFIVLSISSFLFSPSPPFRYQSPFHRVISVKDGFGEKRRKVTEKE